MLRPFLGEAVLRRLRILKRVGLVRKGFEAAETLVALLESVAPALDERGIDEVLEAMRLAVDITGREGREKLKKKVRIFPNVCRSLEKSGRCPLRQRFLWLERAPGIC